jgi:hypothetical protein
MLQPIREPALVRNSPVLYIFNSKWSICLQETNENECFVIIFISPCVKISTVVFTNFPTQKKYKIILVNLAGTAVQQDGLIFFPEFCRVVLRKFREEDEEQFAQVMFKVRF